MTNSHHHTKQLVCVCVCVQSGDGRLEVRGLQGSSSLTISGVRRADRGPFHCEALSRIGGHQRSLFLDVECKSLRQHSPPPLKQITLTIYLFDENGKQSECV